MVVLAFGADLDISRRDLNIVELALRKLRGAKFDFGTALHAFREATAEVIPDGRVYLLGTARGPVFGSLVSGVGIFQSATGIDLVRVTRGGDVRRLGSFSG